MGGGQEIHGLLPNKLGHGLGHVLIHGPAGLGKGLAEQAGDLLAAALAVAEPPDQGGGLVAVEDPVVGQVVEEGLVVYDFEEKVRPLPGDLP